MILSAKRPVVYSGGGVVLDNASESLIEFVQQLDLPITSTLMGLGAYPASDKQFLGMLGMHGTYEANMAMHGTDVLIAIGSRFDDRITGHVERFCPNAKIIHIDIDPSSISKNVRVNVPIVGAVDQVLKNMLKAYGDSKVKQDKEAMQEWWSQIDQWREKQCLRYDKKSEMIKPQYALEILHKVTNGDAYVSSDVGQHQMFAAQFYGFDKPRRWINSGGLGTMGFGLPAAMGVKMAYPESDVVVVTSEASIQMCIQELATCKQYALPLKILMLNNGFMGMVRQWQEFFYDGRYSHSTVESTPDFVKLAESYGHAGMRITRKEDLEQAMTDAFAMKDQLVFMDVVIDPEENVYPMIEAGKGHNEMYLSPESELV